MQTMKQIVCDTVNHLPEQATFDDPIYALYVRKKLKKVCVTSMKAAPIRKRK